MLADLTLVGCYNLTILSTKERDSILLESAKNNLRKMAYFGICENQTESGYLFESTFKMKFTKQLLQLNETRSSVVLENISDDLLQQIKDLNRLDIELYNFAINLIKERFSFVKKKDINFKSNYIRLLKNSFHFDEADERLIKRIEKDKKESKNDFI